MCSCLRESLYYGMYGVLFPFLSWSFFQKVDVLCSTLPSHVPLTGPKVVFVANLRGVVGEQ